jgi:hypothetical protein
MLAMVEGNADMVLEALLDGKDRTLTQRAKRSLGCAPPGSRRRIALGTSPDRAASERG